MDAEPSTTDEKEFAEVMLDYYRKAGRAAAYGLLCKMNDASIEGCYRADHLKAARDAVSGLPTLN